LIELYDFQKKAAEKLKNGSILVGNTGSGKSATSVFYYIQNEFDRDLYIITTAKKRDKGEWVDELMQQNICPNPELNHNQKVVIDSWNNIKKYQRVYGAFFIFDEQRVTGKGAWVKAFLKIARANHWILLSATPGDKYEDYIPVLVANGFYKNKTEFWNEHIIQKPYVNYQAVGGYRNVGKINYYISKILIKMKDPRETNHYNIKCTLDYDKDLYKVVWRDRWNPYDNEPIAETGKLMSLLRRVANSDPSRIAKLEELVQKIPKVIIFYNFDFELELIKDSLTKLGIPFTEWNGHNHEEIITGERWVYLVQYMAGAEGWNCIDTNTIIFYSQTYSYKQREQAKGRIDRLNTPYHDLYYYHLVSYAPVDVAIGRALAAKKDFNEKTFLRAQK
jgi:hypothetical protein